MKKLISKYQPGGWFTRLTNNIKKFNSTNDNSTSGKKGTLKI